MIRKVLIFTVLAVAAAAAIVLPLWKSDAAHSKRQPDLNKHLLTAPCQTLTSA